MDRGRRYGLTDAAASALLALLDAKAELQGAEGQSELTFEHPPAAPDQLVARVVLRFRVGEEVGEIHVSGPDGRTTDAPIYAAGPIERILQAIGFSEVSRAVVVARRYRFQGAELRVAHVKPLGWFCEVRPGSDQEMPEIMAALGASPLVRAQMTEPPRASTDERRQSDRRATRRRSILIEVDGLDRRTTHERRTADRRTLLAT